MTQSPQSDLTPWTCEKKIHYSHKPILSVTLQVYWSIDDVTCRFHKKLSFNLFLEYSKRGFPTYLFCFLKSTRRSYSDHILLYKLFSIYIVNIMKYASKRKNSVENDKKVRTKKNYYKIRKLLRFSHHRIWVIYSMLQIHYIMLSQLCIRIEFSIHQYLEIV